MNISSNIVIENTNPIQLKDAIDLFIENQKMLQRSKLTLRSYHETLKRVCKYLYKKHNRPVSLDEITTCELEEYLYYLINIKKNAARTRNEALKIFGLFYRFCVLKGYCSKDITESIEYAKWQKKERLFMTETELRLIFDTVEKPIIKVVLQTLYYTGMRIGELTELEVGDVDFESNVIHIRNGKGDKERTVPLHKGLKMVLLEYVNNWRLNVNSEYLFCTKTGRISQVYISSELRKTLMLAGIDKAITPHTYRHTFQVV
jgi:Site-specific recombinase XerD